MKQLVLACALFLAALSSKGQRTNDELYGFKQRIIPGAQQAGDLSPSGELIKEKSPDHFQYLIYVATNSKASVYPVQIWINGEAFSVRMSAVNKTPTLQTIGTPANAKPLLRIKSGQRLYQLTPVPLIADKGTRGAKALASKNDIVFYYKKAGKFHYGRLKKFTELPAQGLQ